jgi:hypothetical protein
MQAGYKNTGGPVDPVQKTEEELKRERQDLWSHVKEDVERSGININEITIKRNCEELFGLQVSNRKTFDM